MKVLYYFKSRLIQYCDFTTNRYFEEKPFRTKIFEYI